MGNRIKVVFWMYGALGNGKVFLMLFLFTRAMSQADKSAWQFGECRDNERNSQSVFHLVAKCVD